MFRATQLSLDRMVALKLLHRHLVGNDEHLARLWREAKLTQKLEHPNTVRLFDFGRDENGMPYVAWELLKGQSLERLLEQGKMPLARTVHIASQVLKSLMEAHAAGVIHRDIKPANIFVSDFPGEPDFVKVLDFGLAKALCDDHGPAQDLTRPGHTVGTPSYMAPEQISGGSVQPCSDLYAVGLVMSEMIAGQAVFRGDSAIAVCSEQLSPAPVPHLPGVLRSPLGPVIHRATQKDPKRRFATAAEMLRELEAAALGARDSATPPTAVGLAVAPQPAMGGMIDQAPILPIRAPLARALPQGKGAAGCAPALPLALAAGAFVAIAAVAGVAVWSKQSPVAPAGTTVSRASAAPFRRFCLALPLPGRTRPRDHRKGAARGGSHQPRARRHGLLGSLWRPERGEGLSGALRRHHALSPSWCPSAADLRLPGSAGIA